MPALYEDASPAAHPGNGTWAAARDPAHLWPEPHSGEENSYSKDSVEARGEVGLSAAQNAILTDWRTAESVPGLN